MCSRPDEGLKVLRRISLCFAGMALLLLLLPAWILAAPAGRLDIDADRLEYDTASGLFKAAGSVRISDRGYSITCGEALFYSKDKGKRVVATGNPLLKGRDMVLAGGRMEILLSTRVFSMEEGVRIDYGSIRAASETAVYKDSSREMVLKGSARAEQPGSSMKADKIILMPGHVRAEGRAHLEVAFESMDGNG